MRLIELARAAGVPMVGRDVEIRGLSTDSRRVTEGDLFVAIPGARRHGLAHVTEAAERGAVAVCAIAPVPGIPTLLTGNPRRALAALAAAFHGFPAHELPLIGVTGSLGKTSTTQILEAILRESGMRVGVIGSLGIRFDGDITNTGMTTPEATDIHAALRRFADGGAAMAVMEVTTHAIIHERVTGLAFGLGILTNLVPDEHLEFHPTPEHYVRTKTRFFDMLAAGAPLIVNFDDAAVRTVTTGLRCPLIGVSVLGAEDATVAIRGVTLGERGTAFELELRRPLTRIDGSTLEPFVLPLTFSLLGSQQTINAALATIAALLAGATHEGARTALASMPPVTRRMEVIHPADPFILDDTVGNPASLRAVFEMADAIPHERLRVVYAVRGARGTLINLSNAEALAECLQATAAELVVTASEDVADERNRVGHDEWTAVLSALREREIAFHAEPTLRAAVASVVGDAGHGDLILLLGAQGMDGGSAIAREVLAARARVA
jgi:UDP-N-acetylmuramoyl-L-alanyl-D-glutamate--2,6-diaminopimelate ligase